jgi:DNA polymerase-3 subunit delta'
VGKSLAAQSFTQMLMNRGINPEKQALINKKILGGNHPDLLWVQPTYQHQGKLLTPTEAAASGLKRKAPPQIRIEQIRDISQFLSKPPLEAAQSVIIIEDAQTMAEGAANALLKTLEEPGRATLILIAPSVDSLLPTLVSRCQRIPFYRLGEAHMKTILEMTGHEAILQHPALLAIAAGSPGEAIVSFEQLQTIPADLLEKLEQIPKNPRQALELAKLIDQNLDTQAQLWLIDYLQYSYWQKWHKSLIIEQLEKARKCLISYVQPRLVWEATLLNICQ